MAKSGLSTFLHAILNEDGTYGNVQKLGGAIAYKETINLNSYKQHEDNALQWEDSSFKDGNINLTIGDDDEAIFANLLGRGTKTITVGGKSYQVYVGNINDISKPVGFGLIEQIRTKAGIRYGVKFYLSVTFKPYATESDTKGDNNTYKTQAVDGTIAAVNGDYIFNKRYDTLATAIEVLYACFGKPVPAASKNADLTALTIGDSALSPTFNADVTSYVTSTADATNKITVAPSDSAAIVVIKNGSTIIANEGEATWVAGENIVTITVTNGTSTKTYIVMVTKTA